MPGDKLYFIEFHAITLSGVVADTRSLFFFTQYKHKVLSIYFIFHKYATLLATI